MAEMHHSFNVLKIPSANGTITVRCNEKDALPSVEHIYREAATMFLTDEDLLEHSGDLTRKKQLMSQEKRFQGLELKHIPRGENVEADEIAKRASHRLAQPAGFFEEHLFKPSASPELPPALPPPSEQGAPNCGPSSGDRVLLALARQEGVD
jgi:hypothetical protein